VPRIIHQDSRGTATFSCEFSEAEAENVAAGQFTAL
jgi:hypothetical protein